MKICKDREAQGRHGPEPAAYFFAPAFWFSPMRLLLLRIYFKTVIASRKQQPGLLSCSPESKKYKSKEVRKEGSQRGKKDRPGLQPSPMPFVS
jgi:hypothetical protein